MAIIDFHSHILPKIDDGSRNSGMTEAMLQEAGNQGINVMVATPHFYADSMTIKDFLFRREKAFEKIHDVLAEKQVEVICGAEVAFFHGISQAKDTDSLCVSGTNLLMIEMPFRAWSGQDLREIEQLLRRGICPIIAHLERFYRFQTDKQLIPELFCMPVYIQINAEALLSWKSRRQVLKLFRDGQAHLLGSDCHNVSSRPENLQAGRMVLEKKLGQHALMQIDQLGTGLLKGV